MAAVLLSTRPTPPALATGLAGHDLPRDRARLPARTARRRPAASDRPARLPPLARGRRQADAETLHDLWRKSLGDHARGRLGSDIYARLQARRVERDQDPAIPTDTKLWTRAAALGLSGPAGAQGKRSRARAAPGGPPRPDRRPAARGGLMPGPYRPLITDDPNRTLGEAKAAGDMRYYRPSTLSLRHSSPPAPRSRRSSSTTATVPAISPPTRRGRLRRSARHGLDIEETHA